MNFESSNRSLWKLIFWLVELIFFYFSDTPSSESSFPSSENVFLNESSDPYGGDAFSVVWKLFFLIYLFIFFLQVETVTEISENPFFGGKTLFPIAEKDLLSSENFFLSFHTSFPQVKTVTETS